MSGVNLNVGQWCVFLKGRRRDATLTATLALVSAGLELFGLSMLLPLLSGSADLDGWQLAIIFGVALSMSSVARFFAERQAVFMSSRLERDLRIETLDVLAESRWSAVSSLDHGELATRLSSTTSQVANGFSALVSALSSLITLTVLGIGAVALDPVMSVILVVYLVFCLPVYLTAVKRARRVHQDLLRLNMESSEEISTILHNAKQLFISASRGLWLSNVRELIGKVTTSVGAERLLAPRLRRDTELLGVAFIAISILLAQTRGSLAATLAFLAVFYRMVPRLQAFQTQFATARGQEVWLRDWNQFMTRLNTPTRAAGLVRFVSGPPDAHLVSMREVALRHPGARSPVVEDFSLAIGPSETVVIVGPTGIGKTTVLDAIAGLIEPECGEVVFSAVDGSNWLKRVAYATQDPVLRSGTIRGNLTWLVPEVDEERMRRVIEVCQLQDFVAARPEGLNARLNLKGSTISGGQRQRLALARTLMSPADLLILDEATSAMDQATERRLLEALFSSGLVGSVVAVTHRLESTRLFSRVVDLGLDPVGGVRG